MRNLSDYSVGQVFAAGPLEVTENEIISFAERYDPQPFHTDVEAAKSTFFKGLAASGWMTAALTMRMMVESDLRTAWGLIGREVESLKWLLPVRPGDVLRAAIEVIEVIPTKPDRGWVRFRTDTYNQKDELVQTMTSCGLAPTGKNA